MTDILNNIGTEQFSQQAAEAASKSADLLFWILIGTIAIALIIMVSYFIIWNSRFKHRVLIKELVRGRTIIKGDRARSYKDKQGNIWWKLAKLKAKIPEPPSECVEITGRGKKWCAFYHVEEAGFIPIKDSSDYETIKEEKMNTEGFQAFTPQQRSVLINELVASDQYKKKGINELLGAIIPAASMVIMLALLLIFWGDVVEPFQTMADKTTTALTGTMDRMNTYLERLDALEQDVQVLQGSNEYLNGSIEPPN